MAAKAKAKAPPEGGPNPLDPPGGQLAAQNELVVQLLQQNQQLMQQLLAQQQAPQPKAAPPPPSGESGTVLSRSRAAMPSGAMVPKAWPSQFFMWSRPGLERDVFFFYFFL